MNEVAPDGYLWVCMACGKRSRDKYGNQKLSRGWDVSCVLNAQLLAEDQLVIVDGLVKEVRWDEPGTTEQS